MGRIGITYLEVSKAIASIQGKQQVPTVDRIRDILGTGSRSTISKYLREWKEKNQLLPTDELGMPVELLQMVKSLWAMLKEKSDNELEQARTEIKAESIELSKSLQTEKQQTAILQKEVHQLEEINSELNQQVQILQKSQQDANTEIQRLNERISVMKENKEAQVTEQKRLHDLINHLQNNLSHYQESSQKLRQEQSIMLDKQRQDHEHKLSQLQNMLSEANKQASINEHKFNQSNTELEKITPKYTKLKIEFANIQKTNEQITFELSLLKDDHKALKAEHHQQLRTMTIIEEKLRNEKESSSHVKHELEQSHDKIEKLRSDYQFMAQEKAKLEGFLQMQKTKSQNIKEPA